MMEGPPPEDVRRVLAALDTRQQKIVIGMLGVMIREPRRAREREWVAEQLTEVTLLAGEFPADTPQAGVQVVQEYLQDHAAGLLSACYLLFQRVGSDLAPRAAAGFTFDEALRCGLSYLPGGVQDPPAKADVSTRDLGEQPLARLMSERGLEPKHLVAASPEQLTHKMVTRAMKGRRLTANTMGKVHRAWNLAASCESLQGELFNYRP